MSFELTGKILEIFNEQLISDKFRKREFIVEYKDTPGSLYPQILKFQVTGDKCNLLDPYKAGQDVTISFNLRGRKYQKDGRVSYFMDLEAWKILPLNASSISGNDLPAYDSYRPEDEDANGGLPF
ncbi:MAG TPA: DUF3127 domain-containing protein [Lentimicrobium sp.]|nr:DUF3127 domain-containing protein [Lentimicrobium sp.]